MIRPDALHDLLIAAAREFNAGRYFEAHEVLEDGLENVPDHLWDLFLGLIQIAVGYHKVTQNLRRGAAAMLGRALEKVERFPPEAAGLNLEALRQRVRADIEQLRGGRFDGDTFARHPPRMQPLSVEGS
jgi:uncharacterized protein